jgi:hypothetical protein
MKRQHYVIESDDLANLAETHIDAVDNAREARADFAHKFRADQFRIFQTLEFAGETPVIISITALQFSGVTPAGFARSDRHPGFSIPDVTTERGRVMMGEMAELPPIPLPKDLAGELGYGHPLKIRPDMSAVCMGVELLAGSVVLTVPVFSPEEVAESPTLSWTPLAGLRQISESEFKDMREFSQEQKQRSASHARF